MRILYIPDEKLYQQHLERLQRISPRLDTRSGRVNVANVMKLGNVMSDVEGFNKIHNYNVGLLRSLNEIKAKFLDGVTTSKTSSVNAAAMSSLSTPAARIQKLQLAKDNIYFAARIDAVRNRNQDEELKAKSKALKCQVGKFKLPEKILAKYEGKVPVPHDTCLQFLLFRPSIFIDLEAKNERPIGRVSFQLFTEACPQIILELLKVFLNKQNEKLKFSRVYPNLWAECDIAVDSKNFSLAAIEYDMRALDNGTGMGVISVDIGRQSRYLKNGLLILVISFKPLPVLNGRRVAIGRITNGRRNLIGLSEYGTKNGKPLKNIVVTQMGVIEN